MAVWGAPIAHEDDAERAVRAALDLIAAIPDLGPGISARAGVLTGEAAVTIGAVGEGMVAGDLVNTAARIQSVAEPGSVFVGDGTVRAAEHAFRFEAVGAQQMKGKAAPVPVWRTVGPITTEAVGRRAGALETPFVGRDDELGRLKDAFLATQRDRRVRLVSVIGPGGSGKTRLAWEFLRFADSLDEIVWWHAGRCPAYGDRVSFWALGEMVRQRCFLLEDDDAATTRERVAATLEALIEDADERRWIERSVLALFGLERGVSADQLFAGWRALFERTARLGPVVLVFEDLHNADPGLLAFIDHMVENVRGVPLLILTLARPALLERNPTWGAGKRNFTSLDLDAIPADGMRTLLTGLVPGLPDSARDAIVARAEGVPLYAVETVRMLLAEGRVEFRDGVCTPVGDLSTLSMPESLTALIASHLDALEPAQRALVADASVLGQAFPTDALAAVSGLPDAVLAPRLAALVRAGILVVDEDPRSPTRGQHLFAQGLVREVAYRTLARRDRLARHLAVARWLEASGTDETAGILAEQYLAAWQNSPKDAARDDLAARARALLRVGAERATSLGSDAQAFAFLETALSVEPPAAERAELLGLAAAAAEGAGRFEDAERLLAEAAAAAG